ncbi:hypothetical protein ES705_45041 [subsurface metagenome]
MTGFRCLNDQTGYCNNPERQCVITADCSDIGHPGVHVLLAKPPASCPLVPRNCGFFIIWEEVCRGIKPIEE